MQNKYIYQVRIWCTPRDRNVAMNEYNMCISHSLLTHQQLKLDHAIPQAVSRWISTAAARVRAQVRACGICRGQSSAAAGFIRVLRFPLSIFIPPIAPQSPSSIIWEWDNRPVMAALPSGLGLTPLIIIQLNSIRVYLRANLTAQRPVTKLAQIYGNTQK
jgi:hypothetical protein